MPLHFLHEIITTNFIAGEMTVIQRADEITELLAYYQLANERTDVKKLNRLSKQIQNPGWRNGIALSVSLCLIFTLL